MNFNSRTSMFSTATLSKPGARDHNEDYIGFLDSSDYGCWVVADGLGGHGGGEIAARLAVEVVLEMASSEREISKSSLERFFLTAQQKVLEAKIGNSELSSMHTTLVILLRSQESFIWGHVGDSRCYIFHSGKLAIQTRDHSVSQALVTAGELEQAGIRYHEDRNRLLQALGTKEDVRASIAEEKWNFENRDAFLLCTDGFWENITESEMEMQLRLAKSAEDWIKRMEAIVLSNGAGCSDNYSAIVIV